MGALSADSPLRERIGSSLHEQVQAVQEGLVTAEELAPQVRDDITQREPELRAWVELSPTSVDEARSMDRATGPKPLHGVSFGVKDLIDVAGMPTRAGSSVTPAENVTVDAPCVTRLRELGAVVQGKTVTTEFGYFAPGPTRNPHHLDHTPGGSSSGSAAAVGSGTIPLALGTQTAGSLTRPASYCGAAGMVLAHGSTDLSGITGLSDSLDSLGLLTRSVADLRLVHDAFVGREYAPAVSPPRTTEVLVWSGSDLGSLDPAMASLLEQVPTLFEDFGMANAPLDWDDHVQTLTEDQVTVMSYEAARTRAREYDHQPNELSTPLRELLKQGRDIPETAYTSAMIRRDRSRDQLGEILGTTSIIVGPAALGPAPSGLSATGSPTLSRPWQLLGLPVVVVPGARTAAGMPLGLQIISLPGNEDQMFDTGVKLEAALREQPPVAV